MTVHSMNNMRFGHITGFNSYRGANAARLGSESMLYNNSIYGLNSRNGNGSRFYNPGPVGTYVQFNPPDPPEKKSSWWKTALGVVAGVGLALLGVKLFSGSKTEGTEKSSKPIDENIFNNNKSIMGSEMDDN